MEMEYGIWNAYSRIKMEMEYGNGIWNMECLFQSGHENGIWKWNMEYVRKWNGRILIPPILE